MSPLRAAFALIAGAIVLVSGCSVNDQSAATSSTTSGEAAATGALTIIALDSHGDAISGIDIEIERALDCDVTQKQISPGTSYTNHFSGTTNGAGKVQFDHLPFGCYHVSSGESDDNRQPEGMEHAVFLTNDAPVQSLELKFGRSERGGSGKCDPKEISDDLDIPQEQRDAPATIVECEPNWSIIQWDVPGDSQRVVRVFGDKWVTYVTFPTDRCWKQARHDGAPRSFEKYFQPC